MQPAGSAGLIDAHINVWLKQYNYIRPHRALNMKPPTPETLLKNGT
ncbi:MAG: transposase [Marinovum sp.]|nr:transposase [Marinovum sp.]